MISCPKCQAPSLNPMQEGTLAMTCPACAKGVEGMVFSLAPWRRLAVVAQPVERAAAAVDGSATCYHCPQLAAVAACHHCGAYLCSGCSVNWLGQPTCFSCIHSQREIKETGLFETKRTIPDNLALFIILVPFCFFLYLGFFVWVLTAPYVIWLAWRHWARPHGLVPRSRLRMMAAAGASLLFLLALAGGITYLLVN